MDVLPAHLNRDSFRDSFKGLVALEIIFDLPIVFSNKQHYLSALSSTLNPPPPKGILCVDPKLRTLRKRTPPEELPPKLIWGSLGFLVWKPPNQPPRPWDTHYQYSGGGGFLQSNYRKKKNLQSLTAHQSSVANCAPFMGHGIEISESFGTALRSGGSFMSRKQKISSQDPPPKEKRSNIWSKT